MDFTLYFKESERFDLAFDLEVVMFLKATI